MKKKWSKIEYTTRVKTYELLSLFVLKKKMNEMIISYIISYYCNIQYYIFYYVVYYVYLNSTL